MLRSFDIFIKHNFTFHCIQPSGESLVHTHFYSSLWCICTHSPLSPCQTSTEILLQCSTDPGLLVVICVIWCSHSVDSYCNHMVFWWTTCAQMEHIMQPTHCHIVVHITRNLFPWETVEQEAVGYAFLLILMFIRMSEHRMCATSVF